ncbi:MAG: LysR family transcriptional regulator [Polyangiales bacterium]
MADLNELQVFAQVAALGSFTRAAAELDMPKSTVSRKVSELEARLGVRLLQRTTRKLSLTEAGHTYFAHAQRVLAELEEAELAVTRMQDAPRGLLRVTAPLNFNHLAPVVAVFLQRFPEVQVELVCADRVVDLVHEGFDVAVRVGALSDSSLIARSLGSVESHLVASPAFLAAHGAPANPSELSRLPALGFGVGSMRPTFRLVRAGAEVAVQVTPRLVVNDFVFLDEAARAGLGVALLPLFRCAEDLESGALVRVLPEWCSPPIPLHAVYPSTRHLSPKVSAFLDHLAQPGALTNGTPPSGAVRTPSTTPVPPKATHRKRQRHHTS